MLIRNTTDEKIYAIHELPDSLKNQLTAARQTWLNSLEFCLFYSPAPAQYVCMILNNGIVEKAVFYRIRKLSSWKIVEIIGFPEIDDSVVQNLMHKQKAQLVVINRLEDTGKNAKYVRPTGQSIYFKNYVTIINLPQCKNQYISQLGKSHRKQLFQYFRKLFSCFNDDIDIRIEQCDNIQLEDVIQLEYLNRERRAKKGKGVDTILEVRERQEKRWCLTKECGLLVTLRYKGKIIGGTLSYVHGTEAVMILTAHDMQYDHLRIGKLCIWKTIEYLIENGYSQCNLLWGKYKFKTQFRGVEYPWHIHIVSEYPWLANLWKLKIGLNDLYQRLNRYFRTKLDLEFEGVYS